MPCSSRITPTARSMALSSLDSMAVSRPTREASEPEMRASPVLAFCPNGWPRASDPG